MAYHPELVLIFSLNQRDTDHLALELSRVREARIAAGVWESASVTEAVGVYHPTLIVRRPETQLPAGVGVPDVVIPPDADPVAFLTEYLAARQEPQAPEPATPAPAGAPEPPPLHPVPAPASQARLGLARPRRTVRLGFWGERGGVGTTTAALTAARLLAQEEGLVAVVDATERGDTFLYLGHLPQPEPLQEGRLILFPSLPAEAALPPQAHLIIDGGRQQRAANVAWIKVTAPLDDDAVARLLE
jgi:hypothetical protein